MNVISVIVDKVPYCCEGCPMVAKNEDYEDYCAGICADNNVFKHHVIPNNYRRSDCPLAEQDEATHFRGLGQMVASALAIASLNLKYAQEAAEAEEEKEE